MGKATGFLEFERNVPKNKSIEERIKDYNEFHNMLSFDNQMNQGARCMDCGIPFCQFGVLLNNMTSGCPLNNLIPEFNDLLYKGNLDLALKRLLKTNPFPEFTGRVCPAPCESACTVSLNGSSVTIKENERFIIDTAFENNTIKPSIIKYRINKRVAVIGSGPAGLSCSYYLNKLGYYVDVYEREDNIGGLLMYGIPNMKLDKSIINRRVKILEEEGIRFFKNLDPCKDEALNRKILAEYDSIVLATGSTKPRDLKVKGRDGKGIYFAVDYLKENTRNLLNNNKNFISCKDKKVLVIGGGDTGTDCVATAIRQNCRSIIQLEIANPLPLERCDNNPWPEWRKTLKVDYGQEEAINIFGEDPRKYTKTVKEFIYDESNKLKEAKIVDVKWFLDENKRLTFKEVEKSERIIEVDIVLIAMGFLGTEEYITKSFNLNLDNRGNIKAKYGDFKTNIEKIFTCGDARRGQSLVVWAIKEGIEAALSVNNYLESID